MTARIRSHIRSNLVASIALLLALSGGTTAYAIDGSLPGQNTVGSEDIINGEAKLADVGANAVSSGKIQDGAVEARDVHQNAVDSAKVVNDSLAGADVNEATLNGAAIPGDTARDRWIGGYTSCHPWQPCWPVGLLPGLSYFVMCSTSGMSVYFLTGAPGTANAMIVANGVDPAPSTEFDFNVANGATAQGTVLEPSYDWEGAFFASYRMRDGTGSASAESQFVIDAGGKTYSVALHTYHRVSDKYCETIGNVTVAK